MTINSLHPGGRRVTPTTQEFDDEFARLYEKVHGEPPTEYALTKWREGLRRCLEALAAVECEVYLHGGGTDAEWAIATANAALQGLERKVDKAWAYNREWEKAAVYAEQNIVGHVENAAANDRFYSLMARARLHEAVETPLPDQPTPRND